LSRILAIDYGQKRTGLAVTDSLQLIANGLDTIPTHTLYEFLCAYIEKEPVERIIIGLPRQTNGLPSENMKRIEPLLHVGRKTNPMFLSSIMMSVSPQYWLIVQ